MDGPINLLLLLLLLHLNTPLRSSSDQSIIIHHIHPTTLIHPSKQAFTIPISPSFIDSLSSWHLGSRVMSSWIVTSQLQTGSSLLSSSASSTSPSRFGPRSSVLVENCKWPVGSSASAEGLEFPILIRDHSK